MTAYIGLMSGTSMDGIDACLVDFSDDDSAPPRLLATHHGEYPSGLLDEMKALARSDAPHGVHRMARLDAWLGECFADAARKVMHSGGVGRAGIAAIGSHGQTLRHAPAEEHPYTLQIGDPHRIAERTGLTVIADFRRRDIAAGGQGAPLVPPAHAALFGHAGEYRVIANIGGIANITLLPPEDATHAETIRGFDTGPGNTLMDAWILRHQGVPFDRDGAWAQQGQVNTTLLERLLDDPYFGLPAPKSTGPELFNPDWLASRGRDSTNILPPEDVQATLLELTARSLIAATRKAAPGADRVLVCGGGAYNTALLARLRELGEGMTVETTAAHGIEPAWVEAMAFAWLARQTLRGLPGNLPSVTGARGERILGAIYPATPGGEPSDQR
ncbi:MAG: anhydro-N-acetylmuramic acid kinase [Pseudomonadota bacterium]